MADDRLKPAETFRLQPGQSVTFDRKVTISVDQSGRVAVNGRSDPQIVEFSYSGSACSYRCFAVMANGAVRVFRGSTIGRGMITKEEVLAACY